MNNKPTRAALPANDSASAIELRLASRLAGALTLRSQSLPTDVSERLRFARERALAHARAHQRGIAAASSAAGAATTAGGGWLGGLLGGFSPWLQRAASVLPLILLVFGLIAIDQWSTREQVLAAAEIDSQLLADDLPPDAYSDPGFAEFLRTPPS